MSGAGGMGASVPGNGMASAPVQFDFAAVLSTVAQRRASDLHLTAGLNQ